MGGPNTLVRVGLTDHVTGYPTMPMPKTMTPAMMRRLLGGRFPNTGFSWDMVYEFRWESDCPGSKTGTWEPYNEFNEILPASGFAIKVTPTPSPWD
jgi:hypothetical protein